MDCFVGPNKYYIYYLMIAVQFFMLPAFYDFDIVAKYFILSAFLPVFYFFAPSLKISKRIAVVTLSVTAWLLISSCLSYHQPTAFVSLGIVIALILYFPIINNAFPRGITIDFYWFFLTFILIASLLGLYQYTSFSAFGKSVSPLIAYILPPNSSLRVSGIYGQSNFFSLVLNVGVFSYIYVYLHGHKILPCKSSFYKALYYLPLSVVFFVSLLTKSRSGQIAFVFCIVTVFYYLYKRNYLNRHSALCVRFVKICTVLTFTYAAFIWIDGQVSGSAIRSFANPGMSLDARFVFWFSSALMFLDYPVFGIGIDNFKFYLPDYVNRAHELLGFVEYEAMGYTKWSHNEVLQLLCETGVVGVLLLFVLLWFIYDFGRLLSGRRHGGLRHLFSHVYLILFILQSMFSWPLRHPSILFLFVFFAASASVFLRKPRDVVIINRSYAIKIAAFLVLLPVMWIGYSEYKMGHLFRSYDYSSLNQSFSDFEQLVENPYLEYPLLLNAVPSYVKKVVDDRDVEFGQKVLPYVERLVSLHGAHWQWYNAGLIYLVLGRNSDAMESIENAIELRPTENKYWMFKHYINMLRASQETGRPLKDFLPIPPGGSAKDLEGMFDLDGRIKINM